MGDDAVVSRRAWLVGLAGRAAGRVAEAVEDRIPEPLLAPADDAETIGAEAIGAEAIAAAAVEPEPIPTVLHLRANRCIAILGIECGACARLCPEGVRGLWMERRKPVIDPEACVSCGACVEACPTSPRALELVPDAAAVAHAAAVLAAASAPAGAADDARESASDVDGMDGAGDDNADDEAVATDVIVEPVRPDWSVPK